LQLGATYKCFPGSAGILARMSVRQHAPASRAIMHLDVRALWGAHGGQGCPRSQVKSHSIANRYNTSNSAAAYPTTPRVMLTVQIIYHQRVDTMPPLFRFGARIDTLNA